MWASCSLMDRLVSSRSHSGASVPRSFTAIGMDAAVGASILANTVEVRKLEFDYPPREPRINRHSRFWASTVCWSRLVTQSLYHIPQAYLEMILVIRAFCCLGPSLASSPIQQLS